MAAAAAGVVVVVVVVAVAAAAAALGTQLLVGSPLIRPEGIYQFSVV